MDAARVGVATKLFKQVVLVFFLTFFKIILLICMTENVCMRMMSGKLSFIQFLHFCLKNVTKRMQLETGII
jgi:hypothetical protein